MIAVVGTGSIGRRHLQNLVGLGHEVLAVSEHRQASSLHLAGTEVPCVPSLEAALAQHPSAIVVGNPTSMHERTTAEAIAAGVDVYLEKPAALTGAACADLEVRAREAGVVVAIGQQLRFHPLLERAHEIVRGGALGTVLAVEANLGEHLADYHPDEDYRGSYAARRELGGGVLLTQIHLIDILTWLFGPFRTVTALGGHRTDLEVDVEDSVSFLAQAVDDAPVYGHLDYLQRPRRWALAVTGTEGRVEVDLPAGTLRWSPSGGDPAAAPIHDDPDRNSLFVAAMTDFLAAAQARGRARCTLGDATEALRLVDAIKGSMASGEPAIVGAPAVLTSEVRADG